MLKNELHERTWFFDIEWVAYFANPSNLTRFVLMDFLTKDKPRK